MILILTLLQIFQKFWYWYWIPPIFFKNVDIDFDCFLPISTILILILIFSRDFKILDLDIEAKKPFLPISAGYDMKLEMSAETYQVGAHFKAPIKAILVAPLKSFERFFRISSSPAGVWPRFVQKPIGVLWQRFSQHLNIWIQSYTLIFL